jgi:hypothetical protein
MPNYFTTVSAADAIAATLNPAQIPYYVAAMNNGGDTTRYPALFQASDELDRGMRYQGRKFHRHQPNEFPRVAYEVLMGVPFGLGYGFPEWSGEQLSECVWDWDCTTHDAVVPNYVYEALVLQADFILAPASVAANERRDAIHMGVRGQAIGSMREEYDKTMPGVRTPLCRKAYVIMERYRLKQGRME